VSWRDFFGSKLTFPDTSMTLISGSLYSFAKFLELLCYSPAICVPSPPLCEHTTPPSQTRPTPNSLLPKSRLEIIRHFSYQIHSVSIGLSAVDDIFELQFPRLQISRTNSSLSSSETRSEPSSTSRDSDLSGNNVEKKVLRYEIKSWWQGVVEHIDQLVSCFLLYETSAQ
jgi:1-phosphatidylinositol-3-phosphate 5-kinase